MSEPAWDLDSAREAEPAVGFGVPFVLLIGFGLLGLGIGALAGSAFAPAPAPRSPPAATLAALDLNLDTRPASAGGPTPVVVLRLQVNNPGPAEVRLVTLVVDGVAKSRTRLAVDLRIPAHQARERDVTLHPDCSLEQRLAPVSARLSQTESGNALRTIPVMLAGELGQPGGLCSMLNNTLPNGWRTPLHATSAVLQGLDFEVTVADLPPESVAGVLVGDRLIPTVFVGDHLLSASVPSSARSQPGEDTELRLKGPPPCVDVSGNAPTPATLRLLAQGKQGVQQRLVVVGPDLARWLSQGCQL